MKTPQESEPELAQALGLQVPGDAADAADSAGAPGIALYFKREDLYPYYGSHKGRSIPPMIDSYVAAGIRRFAISSSGNGGLAAAVHVVRLNQERSIDPLALTIFVGMHIHPKKLDLLRDLESKSDGAVAIEQTEKPLRKLLEAVKDPLVQKGGHKLQSLRQSTNPGALLGYRTLAEELLDIPDLQAVFIPSSSGTTAQGLGQAFERLGRPLQIHIVQTEQVHRLISDEKDQAASAKERSLADAIVDTVGHRRNAIREIVQKSGGAGWIVDNAEIEAAVRLTKEKTGLDISPNSALSIAGLQKMLGEKTSKTGKANPSALTGGIVCLITGN